MEGYTILLTGYSGAGKTTLAIALKKALESKNQPSEILDGDAIRKKLSPDLTFSKEDRLINARRIGYLSGLLSRHGVHTIISMIAPYVESREIIRAQVKNFVEVYVRCPLAICEKRDVKGLYEKAKRGEIQHLTGISDPYEEPVNPDVICDTDKEAVLQSVTKILESLEIHQLLEEPGK